MEACMPDLPKTIDTKDLVQLIWCLKENASKRARAGIKGELGEGAFSVELTAWCYGTTDACDTILAKLVVPDLAPGGNETDKP